MREEDHTLALLDSGETFDCSRVVGETCPEVQGGREGVEGGRGGREGREGGERGEGGREE